MTVVRPFMTRCNLLDQRSSESKSGWRLFIKDEDARVLQHHAGDGDALPFATAEAVAALPDNGVVLVGQARDKVVDVGGA